MKIPERIETERLIIRPFVSQDFAAFWSFMSDPDATRFMMFTEEQSTNA